MAPETFEKRRPVQKKYVAASYEKNLINIFVEVDNHAVPHAARIIWRAEACVQSLSAMAGEDGRCGMEMCGRGVRWVSEWRRAEEGRAGSRNVDVRKRDALGLGMEMCGRGAR